MEASHHLFSLLPSLPVFSLFSALLLLLFSPSLSQASGIPLRQGWSFSADLSSSSPLPLNAFFSSSLSVFTPILSSSNFSSGKGFSLGFLSFFASSSPSPTSISLSVCLGTNKIDTLGKAFAIPVWKLNTRAQLKQVGAAGKVSLRAESSKGGVSVDLVLRNGDGSELWRVQGVVAMEMQENGNWVLYNTRNEVAWQSYDHPGDTIVQGQKIPLGMKIVSSNSLFTMEMKAGGLLLHMESQAPAPLYYFGFPINSSEMVQYVAMHVLDLSPNPPINITSSFLSYACPPGSPGFIEPFASLTGPNLTVQGGCSLFSWPGYTNDYANHTYNSDILRLADSGELEGFTYLHQSGENIVFSAKNGTSTCLPPYACGAYGICSSFFFGSSQRSCQCPGAGDNEQLSNVFHPIDPSDLSRGCARAIPLQCSDHVNSTLVEMKKSSFSPVHIIYETTYKSHTYPLEECIDLCTSNCSCAGFFYHQVSSFCLPFSDTTGLSNVSFVTIDSPAFLVYVKVQSGGSSSSGAGKVHGPMPSRTERPTPNRSNKQIIKAVVFTICATTVALLVCLIIVSIKRYQRHVWIRKDLLEMDTDAGEEELQEALPMLPVRYSYRELHEVTKGFKKLLGSGAFGSVYEGVLRDGRRVAVKKLDQVSPRMKQFLAEVTTMGGASHYNVVRLYGFCSQRSKRLLVYEFMDNGSLDKWLFCKNKERMLSWSTRYDIALGTARGLAYLHGECTHPIIHFDIKPQNILLDKNFVPKLSDFGLSKLVQRESSFVMTGVRGTPGYLAPEWLSHSVVSKKCDVYSYGMVLLELVGGRRNAIQSLVGSDEWYFPTWAALKWQQGKVTELVDKSLEGCFDEEQVRLVVHLAFLCIQKEPTMRPTMGDVCKMLEGLVPLNGKETPPFSLNVFEQPLSPEADFSLASCSILREGR